MFRLGLGAQVTCETSLVRIQPSLPEKPTIPIDSRGWKSWRRPTGGRRAVSESQG